MVLFLLATYKTTHHNKNKTTKDNSGSTWQRYKKINKKKNPSQNTPGLSCSSQEKLLLCHQKKKNRDKNELATGLSKKSHYLIFMVWGFFFSSCFSSCLGKNEAMCFHKFYCIFGSCNFHIISFNI